MSIWWLSVHRRVKLSAVDSCTYGDCHYTVRWSCLRLIHVHMVIVSSQTDEAVWVYGDCRYKVGRSCLRLIHEHTAIVSTQSIEAACGWFMSIWWLSVYGRVKLPAVNSWAYGDCQYTVGWSCLRLIHEHTVIVHSPMKLSAVNSLAYADCHYAVRWTNSDYFPIQH
jgi:hypothetical protein